MALKIQRMFSSNGKSAFDGNSFFHKICRDIRFRQNLYAGRSRQYFCSENSGKSRGVSDGSCIGNSFEQPNRFKTNGYRDFCFMRLMYDTAARCQELVDAKIHDLSIRKTHATICLTGKGNKLRIVPISPSVVELLKTYLDKAHPTEQRQSDDYLFFTTHHGRKSRMSTDAVNLFMKKYGEMARRACPEVPERVHPHQLRHSRAMHLYRAGMPLVLLSEFLGHADINTTRIYAWADTEMKRQAIQRYPRSRREILLNQYGQTMRS